MFLRKYETVALVDPDGGTEAVDKVLGRMREAIEKTGGREVRLEDWGRRKTAYRLQGSGKMKAQYMYMLYLGTNGTVSELERLLKITEPAMLWQTILLEDRIDPETFDFETEGGHLTALAKRAQAARDEAEARATAREEAAAAEQDDEDADVDGGGEEE